MIEQPHALIEPAPPRWEVEWRVVEIVADSADLDRARVTPESEIIADLHIDSLDWVELLMKVEDAFGVELPDETMPEAFTRHTTLRMLAEWVVQQWGTGTPERRAWTEARQPLPQAERVPFTQLGGALAPREREAGPMYTAIGLNREGFTQYRRATDGMRCVLIPAAEVWLGCSRPDALSDELPRPVPISAFLIDAEPISNAAFSRFLNSAGPIEPEMLREWCGVEPDDRRGEHYALRQRWGRWEPLPGTEEQPMMLVSWYGANAYSLWANRRDWRCYRDDEPSASILPEAGALPLRSERFERRCFLLSEAEWEYAARGSAASQHPGAAVAPDVEPPGTAPAVAWHRAGATYTAATLPSAAVNERRGMSPFGLHHMAGNVWQWCWDWFAPDIFQRPEAESLGAGNRSPTGIRSERGGSWVGPAALAHPCYRRGRPPAARGRCLGFRCVGSIEDLP